MKKYFIAICISLLYFNAFSQEIPQVEQNEEKNSTAYAEINKEIFFENGKTTFTKESQKLIDDTIKDVYKDERKDNIVITLTSYFDNDISLIKMLEAQHRADSTKRYLQKYQISPSDIQTEVKLSVKNEILDTKKQHRIKMNIKDKAETNKGD